MHPMLNIAVRAARKTGNLIIKNYEIPNTIENYDKVNNNINSIDCYAERLIIEVIHKSYPQHLIISKENGKLISKDKNIQWIIDPLNGAVNFIKRLPHFSISIAVRIKERTEVAVIYDPIRNELFTAVRGQGAQLNGYRLRSSKVKDLKGSVLITSFPFNTNNHVLTYIELMRNLFNQSATFRYTGSTALDLAYIAAGRVDGYFELGLKPKSFIAGELLIRESGGLVTDFIGGHSYISSGNLVAGNPHIVKMLLSNMRK